MFSVSLKSTGVNLLNQKHIEKKLASIKPEYIINCAANTGSLHYVIRNSADIVHDNIVSTLNIYNAAKKIKKTSSDNKSFSQLFV